MDADGQLEQLLVQLSAPPELGHLVEGERQEAGEPVSQEAKEDVWGEGRRGGREGGGGGREEGEREGGWRER